MTDEEKKRIRQQNSENVRNPSNEEYQRRFRNSQEGSDVRHEHMNPDKRKIFEDSFRKKNKL